MEVKAVQDVTIRGAVPVQVKATLAVAGTSTTVNVESAAADLVEVDPSAHVDADRSAIAKLPVMDPAGGLSQAIVYTTGGVAADGNGFFHPLRDHAQVTFVIDGQPISDQQIGQENDDHNVDRVQPRHVFNLGIGTDNLFHSERHERSTASFEIANLTNKAALYNFLSTFSGTHFLQPRTFVGRIGLVF